MVGRLQADTLVSTPPPVMDLLERIHCIRQLEVALADAIGGSGRIALVSGEAGIGKTTLIQRFVEGPGARARLLWGNCDAQFTPRPLGPLRDMARSTAWCGAAAVERFR